MNNEGFVESDKMVMNPEEVSHVISEAIIKLNQLRMSNLHVKDITR